MNGTKNEKLHHGFAAAAGAGPMAVMAACCLLFSSGPLRAAPSSPPGGRAGAHRTASARQGAVRGGSARAAHGSNPARPLMKRAYDVALSGREIYLAVTGGLVVLRVNHCRNPKGSRIRHCRVVPFLKEGALVLPDSANGLALRGRRLLVAQGTWGLALVDVRRPSRPKLVAHLALPGAAMAVAWQGRTAYVAMGSMGLALVDMRRPGAPKLLGTFPVGGYAWSVAVFQGIGLVATGSGGLVVLDLHRPSAPKVLARLKLSGEAREPAFVNRKTAVVAAGKAGLVLVDLSSPTKPKVLSRLATEDFGRGVGLARDFVALAEGQSGAMLARVVGRRLEFVARYRSRKLAINDVAVRLTRGGVEMNLAHDAGGLVRVAWRRGDGAVILSGWRWPVQYGR